MQTETRISAYCQAVQSGQYERPTGLRGKYDNVRNKWEDEVTRAFLRPHLERLVKRRGNGDARLDIADLGCGGGDGLETILGTRRSDCGLAERDVRVIPDRSLARYVGLDINGDLLKQARTRYGSDGRISFVQTDLGRGLGIEPGEDAFDLYFSSFGTFSHFDDAQTVRLLADIARRAPNGALLVCDWLGRYAYEWQSLWSSDLSREQWMDYRISYIYPPEERERVSIDSFSLRLLTRDEVRRLAREAEQRTGCVLELCELFDRSMLVGRHMDTADYNPNAPALREAVNSLYEPGIRTDLDRLRYEHRPRSGFTELNRFQRELAILWNGLVEHTARLCTRSDIPSLEAVPTPEGLTPEVRGLFDHLTTVARACCAIPYGDPRADLLEPQLAGVLQALENHQSQGLGCGHGLVAIFQIKKN